MKAIILAGGIGSRLKSVIPKCMTQLPSGMTIIQNQIYNLTNNGITDITVVVGHKFYLLMEHLAEFTEAAHLLPVKFVLNNGFNFTNTSKSLLLGLESLNIHQIDNDSDVIFMNGDVVFPPEVINELLINSKKNLFTDKKYATLVCNNDRVAEEEIKYSLVDGKIAELSKQVPLDRAVGEAVGINFVSLSLVGQLIEKLNDCDDNDYFEKVFEMLISEGESIYPSPTTHKCIEVDFDADLQQVYSS